SDLFYRLNVVRLRVPPLRERREDIPLLVQHFYQQFTSEADARPPAELVTSLLDRDLPGNVRELRAYVERAGLFADSALWEELQGPVSAPQPAGEYKAVFDPALSFRAAKERARVHWERWYLGELMKRNQGNLSAAARIARMDRSHLRDLLRRYDVYVH